MGVASVPKLGFDLGVFLGDTSAWFWARQRALDKGLDFSKPEVRALVSTDAREISGAMTKSGSLDMQKGVWGIFFQFAANAHKLFLQPFSSKVLSGGEKARLAVARTALYGSYGLGAHTLYEKYKAENYSELDGDTWKLLDGAIQDWAWNYIGDAMYGKDLRLDFAKRFAPVSEYGLPYIEFVHNIMDNQGSLKIPATGMYGKMNQMMYDMTYIFNRTDIEGSDKLPLYIDAAFNLASGYSNYLQASAIAKAQQLVDRQGNPVGIEAGMKVAAAKMLGINPTVENLHFKISSSSYKNSESLRADAKKFHNTLERYMNTAGDYKDAVAYMQQQSLIFNLIEDEDKAEFLKYFQQEDKKAFRERGVSTVLLLDKHIREDMAKDKHNIINKLKQLNDAGNPFAGDLLERLQTEGVLE
jgi:hypothetical protein